LIALRRGKEWEGKRKGKGRRKGSSERKGGKERRKMEGLGNGGDRR